MKALKKTRIALGAKMPHFNSGQYLDVIKYKVTPMEFSRRLFRIGSWYLLPYFPGQEIRFWLWVKRLPTEEHKWDKRELYRYHSDAVSSDVREIPLSENWVRHSITGVQASAISPVEFRFGRKDEWKSNVLVSVSGIDNIQITLLLFGLVVGLLLAWLTGIY